ncbi:MAG: Hsp20/alpha crystallin family protein [Candidatus Doudnabacteria bacterium]|nr:Hsp20/alpha crystallin family protein [Candidatus Doudnabacteria bacterium]
MAKDKNLINKLMGTQAIAEDENMENEETEGTNQPAAASEDWLSEYEGQLTIDMYQTKDNVIIKSTIAGVKPEDIDVTIANDMVTVRGERKRDFEASSEDYFYQECYWGSFSRSVVLPVDVDIDNVSADLKDGILTVVLPKAAKAKAKKIRVGAAR